MSVQIDKGVPIPQRFSVGSRPKWPWREMQPGDSFFAAGYTTKKTGAGKVMVCQNGSRIIPGSTWTMRLVTENGISGVRVWRVT